MESNEQTEPISKIERLIDSNRQLWWVEGQGQGGEEGVMGLREKKKDNNTAHKESSIFNFSQK